MRAQLGRIRHRIAAAVHDVNAMSAPAVRFIAKVIGVIQFAARLVHDRTMDTLNQPQRQACPRLTPGGIGKILVGQMAHRRTGDIAVGDLLNKKPKRVAGRERGVAEEMALSQRQLIDPLRQEKIVRAIANVTEGEMRRAFADAFGSWKPPMMA